MEVIVEYMGGFRVILGIPEEGGGCQRESRREGRSRGHKGRRYQAAGSEDGGRAAG